MTVGAGSSKLSLRTCINCRIIDKRENLIRLALLPGDEVIIDQEKRQGGRGTYVCSKKCLAQAVKHKKMNQAFRKKVKTSRLEKNVLAT